MNNVAAFFAFEAKRLFLGGFGELVLQRIFLPAIALFFSFVVAFTLGKGSAFSSLVKAYSVNLMTFTFWTIRADLFRNIHCKSLWLCNTQKHAYSYTFSAVSTVL